MATDVDAVILEEIVNMWRRDVVILNLVELLRYLGLQVGVVSRGLVDLHSETSVVFIVLDMLQFLGFFGKFGFVCCHLLLEGGRLTGSRH
jgi:hypothetical protein